MQKFYLILISQILVNVGYIECGPQAPGAITGGFTGAGVSSLITPNATNTTHHQNHANDVLHIIIPATTIERSESIGNGCYKQTIREPDYSDPQRYVSTEQLICPPGVNITAVSHQFKKPLYPPVLMTNLSMAPVLMQQKHQPDVFHPQQPVMAAIPNIATSQVMVLSKNTGSYATERKSNSVNTLRALDALVLVPVLALLTFSLM